MLPADWLPECRIVTEINGAPAGHEYARIVGLEVDKLTHTLLFTFGVVMCDIFPECPRRASNRLHG